MENTRVISRTSGVSYEIASFQDLVIRELMFECLREASSECLQYFQSSADEISLKYLSAAC